MKSRSTGRLFHGQVRRQLANGVGVASLPLPLDN
jgi:hypothetical protein